MVKKNEQRTSTVFIRGLPVGTKESTLSETFKGFGNIRQAFVTKSKANSGSGISVGFVKFTTIDEATSAINSVKSIGNQRVVLSYARKKPRKYREPVNLKNKIGDNGSGLSDSDDNDPITNPQTENSSGGKESLSMSKTKNSADRTTVQPNICDHQISKEKTSVEFGSTLPKNAKTVFIQNLMDGLSENQLRKKCRKVGEVEKIILNGTNASVTFKDEESAKLSLKKLNNHVYKQKVITVVSSMLSAKALKKRMTPSRIVIRNLSFKVTEELLRCELLPFGKMLDLSVPKNGEGKIRGFAFVSYINKFEANKALQKLNGKEILGRKVAVDWAVSKEQYVNKKAADQANDDNDDSDKEGDTEDDDEEVEVVPSDKEDNKENESEEDKDMENEEDSGVETEENFMPKRDYDDVKEGRTIFMGNLPFDAEKEDIEDAFSVFGNIRYVRMVYDKEKDRPKGIAFLQYDEKADADSCLQRAEVQPICIGGRTISVKKAVDSKQLSLPESKSSVKSGKDNRNLHLAMEGVIKEGTNAASGISKADMMKRKLALESKKKKLKNINFFVSTDRLCIRNMPSTFSEKDLKQLMSKYGNVVQVKIMRDIKQANSSGIGKSRGYGFVQFSKHEAALAALRATNNNPSTFTPQKRPIVDFSIENSGILNARAKKGSVTHGHPDKTKKSFNMRWKEKREERKETDPVKKPPVCQESISSSVQDDKSDGKKLNIKKKSKKKKKAESSMSNQSKKPTFKENHENSAKPSVASTESSSQSQKSVKRVKKGKSERPNKKQKRDKEQGEEAAFQKLVQNYKGKLQSEDQTRTFKKWYDD